MKRSLQPVPENYNAAEYQCVGPDEYSRTGELYQRTFADNGGLSVRLANSLADVEASQKLRYQVFYEEMSAEPSAIMAEHARDFDRFDGLCDHLLVIDNSGDTPVVVGTYRLLRQEIAIANGGFYTASEFQIAEMLKRAGPDANFMELGRSCVHPDYRTNATIQLLWRGIVVYLAQYKITCMFGCASLEGTDPEEMALPLSFLHHHCGAPAKDTVRALDDRYENMNLMAADEIDAKAALKALPPLIKGYLRLGGMIGDGAVIDHQFGTTDVLILLPMDRIPERIYRRFNQANRDDDRVAV